ncbi:MAG: peptidoglycan DD-metalloendopeptidase family protein [Acutalibacteraceae bacterium]
MNNKNTSFKQKVAAKGFYITAIAAFAVIIASVIISYYTTDRLEPQLDESTSESAGYTHLAQAEKTDVPDERLTSESSLPSIDNEVQTEVESEPETSYRPSSTAATTTAQATESVIVNTSYMLPSSGEITMQFSDTNLQYNKTMGDWRLHLGTDFAGQEGDEVLSVGNGKVTKVVSDTKWGYVVEIDHGDFTGRYCGLMQEDAVSIGETVSAGSVVGRLAKIPIEADDGFHLHFEVIKNGVKTDISEVIS